MKILITGAKGQLGKQIANIINKGYSELGYINEIYTNSQIVCTDINELDITISKEVRGVLNEFKPDIVINTAAYTNVDGCEKNQDLAFKVNALGARNLARECEEIEAKLIHISTDYVFQGNNNSAYKEFDLPKPINVYGKTKYLGEEYVKQFCSKYFIIRTAWLYGYYGKNFVKTIIKAARGKEYLEVVNDQSGNPTNAEDLAYHILKLGLTDEYGIYHCTGKGECSWYDFACKIIEYSKIDCGVKAINSKDLKRAASRPTYSSMDNMMLRCTVGDEMRQWQDAIKVFVQKYIGGNS